MTIGAKTITRDRAYVEKSQIEAYRQLAGIGEPGRKAVSGDQLSAFKSLKDVFLLAACLGLQIGRRTPLKERQELFLTSYLNSSPDLTVLRAIAIAETGQVDVVTSQNDVLTIAEEYANTGFEELRRRVLRAGVPLENLVDLVLEG
jgi:dnd system-associated protein 4